MSTIELKIGLEVISSYKRLSYTPWHALGEFIDNSTQSYRDHKDQLDESFAKEAAERRAEEGTSHDDTHQSLLCVQIEYDRAGDSLVVTDNAMGMDLAEITRAVHVGKPPADTSGRSEFGLGLKTAACWFGDRWTVKTKKLGESKGYLVTFDVEDVAAGGKDLPLAEFDAPAEEHYTTLSISELHNTLATKRLSNTKEFLRSMYRFEIAHGELKLSWNTEILEWDPSTAFLKYNGKEQKKDINFTVGKKKVKGWVGVLAPGASRRPNAGFAMIRRGRVIRGGANAWRPQAVFGQVEGSNDLVNQRIAGEIHLDAFDVTHTKDNILWREDEQSEVEDGIEKRIRDLLLVARTARYKLLKPPRSRSAALRAAIEEAGIIEHAGRLQASLAEALSLRVPLDVLTKAISARAASALKEAPLVEWPLTSETTLRITSSETLSESDAYLTASEVVKGTWLAVVNSMHAVCDSEEPNSLAMNFQHVVADAVLVWAVTSGHVDANPSRWLLLKDAVLRTLAGGDPA